jgi:hypothetical protein
MNIIHTVLVKSLVKTFYRQHAGLFVFLFIVMFGAVGRVDNAGLLDYHLSLVRAMLGNPFLFLIILFLWFLYAQKSVQYIVSTLRRPDFSFLHMLSLLGRKRLFRLMLWIQFLLFIPIIIYLLIIFIAGFYSHMYLPCLAATVYLFVIWIITARWYLFVIQNPGISSSIPRMVVLFKGMRMPFWGLFLRYIVRNKKLLFSGIKLYSCCILYLMVINQTKVEYDLSMITLFFSLGILGHGLLIHQLRDFEETRLTFYRSLPVTMLHRFAQYTILYIVLLLPEIITIILLTPKYLHVKDAVIFFLLAYSVLLFLNSLLFIEFYPMKDYLKITFCIFFVLFLSVLTVTLPLLCLVFFLSSAGIFFWRYYRFERVTVF